MMLANKNSKNLIKMDSELKSLETKLSDPNNSNLESDIERYGHLQEKFMELGGFSYPSMIRGTFNRSWIFRRRF